MLLFHQESERFHRLVEEPITLAMGTMPFKQWLSKHHFSEGFKREVNNFSLATFFSSTPIRPCVGAGSHFVDTFHNKNWPVRAEHILHHAHGACSFFLLSALSYPFLVLVPAAEWLGRYPSRFPCLDCEG